MQTGAGVLSSTLWIKCYYNDWNEL